MEILRKYLLIPVFLLQVVQATWSDARAAGAPRASRADQSRSPVAEWTDTLKVAEAHRVDLRTDTHAAIEIDEYNPFQGIGADPLSINLRRSLIASPPLEHGPSATQTIFMNLYHEANTQGAVKPYIGGGVGVVVSREISREDAQFAAITGIGRNGRQASPPCSSVDTNLAWNAGVGLGWQATEDVSLDLGYRISGVDRTPSVGPNLWSAYRNEQPHRTTHNLSIGLKVNF